ncbi:hypothetical protein OH77DRAFT_535310 [Trametes cingulata]|nr:hypothetical protein OH77DRAFT_535310 [Trametes cingulata]
MNSQWALDGQSRHLNASQSFDAVGEESQLHIHAVCFGIDPALLCGVKRPRSPSPQPARRAACGPSHSSSGSFQPNHPDLGAHPLRADDQGPRVPGSSPSSTPSVSRSPAPTPSADDPSHTGTAVSSGPPRKRAKVTWVEREFTCGWHGCQVKVETSIAWQEDHMASQHGIDHNQYTHSPIVCRHVKCEEARKTKNQKAGETSRVVGSFGRWHEFLRHYRNTHQGCANVCPQCERELSRDDAIKRHLRDSCPGKPAKPGKENGGAAGSSRRGSSSKGKGRAKGRK